MKNIYQKAIKKLLSAKKSLENVISSWLNSLKKDFSFYNNHTEILAIWTILFMTITGLFVVGLKSKISVILLLLILSFIITLTTVLSTTYYLYAIKYHKKKQLLPRTHILFNKSFKLRSLLRFVKIPRISFKHLIKIKRNFKFAS